MHRRSSPILLLILRAVLPLVITFTAHAKEPATTQLTAQTRLDSAGLLGDVDILQRAYETLHPGLYRYNTPAQTGVHFQDLRHALRGNPTLAQAYLAFSRLAASIRCGHTYANFYNQPETIATALFKRDDHLPLQFRWIDRRMIVTHSFVPDATITPGSEILAIDGVSSERILAALLPLVAADGSNEAKRIDLLAVQGKDRFEAFDIYYPLVFAPIEGHFDLRLRERRGAPTRTLRVAAISYAARLAQRGADPEQADAVAWTLHQADPRYAVLDMPTWALFETHWDWQAWLHQTMAGLIARGTPNLVIDLRANGGGVDAGDALLGYLIDDDTPMDGYRHLVRYRRVPDSLMPYLHTWDASFRDWGDAAVRRDARFFTLARDADEAHGNVLHPADLRYRGHVFVLIGATNSSATFEFAQNIQRLGAATLVGQATGGNRRGINGGAFFFLRLPYSHIELDLPLIGQFPDQPQPDAGVFPDVAVAATAQDIAAGRDVELAAAIARMALPASP